MIVDRIEEAGRYAGLHPLFPQAFAFMASLTCETYPKEKTLLDGERLFVVSFSGGGFSREEAKLELHKRYIDIHYLLAGEEEIGWKAGADCAQVDTPFDEAGDYALYSDAPESWVALTPGRFLIVWPGEAHAPRVTRSALDKVVVKILLD